MSDDFQWQVNSKHFFGRSQDPLLTSFVGPICLFLIGMKCTETLSCDVLHWIRLTVDKSL